MIPGPAQGSLCFQSVIVTLSMMKLLLSLLCAIVLTEAKLKRSENTDASEECSDILPEEACQMIALNRGCLDNDAADNCKKTCKVCRGCEDTSQYYCQLEQEKGTLDCSTGEHADYCQKACGKCGEEAASRRENKAGTRKLRRHRRDEEECTDQRDADFCSKMLMMGQCNLPDFKNKAKKCARTCGLCFVCDDLSSLCGTNSIDVCGQEDVEHFCLKTCKACNRRSMAKAMKIRAKRAMSGKDAEDPLAHLLRGDSDCSDISQYCDKMVDDTVTGVRVCDHEDSWKFCRKTCDKCNQRSIAPKPSLLAEDPLLALVMLDKERRSEHSLLNLDVKCEDDVGHCEEIKQQGLCESFETNHICKLTCGLCKP